MLDIGTRKFPRFESNITMEFRPIKKTNTYIVGRVRNYSSVGFGFESETYNVEPREDLAFKLKHSLDDLFVSVQGKAVWTEKSETGCVTGIELKEMDEITRRKMLEIVSATGNIPDDSFSQLTTQVDGQNEAAEEYQKRLSEREEVISEKDEAIQQLTEQVDRQKETAEKYQRNLSEKEGIIHELTSRIDKLNEAAEEYQKRLSEKEEVISEKGEAIQQLTEQAERQKETAEEYQNILTEKDKTLSERKDTIYYDKDKESVVAERKDIESKKKPALIEEFKREHSEILAILNEVNGLDILSKEGQAKLMSVITILLEHLEKEDVKFYPVLCKVAEYNKRLKNVLDVLAMDKENVSSFALGFVDKYSRGVLGKELQGEIESFLVALRNRIRNEEYILYVVYEKMNQLSSADRIVFQ